MKPFRKQLICSILALGLLGAPACGGRTNAPASETPQTAAPTEAAPLPTEAEEEIVLQANTPAATPQSPEKTAPAAQETEAPTAGPTAEPTEATTPVPEPVRVTIGAVGDIMVPSYIIDDAKTGAGEYDFSPLFAPFADLFASVDLMCGNLETPLAGGGSGYSQKKDAKTNAYLFNAPDSVLDALKAYGADVLTTGNNHCLDKGAAGLYRTVETVRQKGFVQTGTFLNAEDRQKPCVVEVNGIRIGIVASTKKVNSVSSVKMDETERQTAIGYLQKGDGLTDAVIADIARTKDAGAEFVIVFAHWDFENDKPAAEETRRLAKALFAAGADCIIGSHPHRIKGAEYMTVQRQDGPYTGLVLYSLGNFTANNTFEKMVGLFAEITLEKDFETGTVALADAAVLPTITIRRGGDRQGFTVVPAYADPDAITGLSSPLTQSEKELIQKARAHAFNRLGTVNGLRVLDEP